MATAEDMPTVKALSLGTAAVAASVAALAASVAASATAAPASVAASATAAPASATGAASVAGAAAAVVRNGEQLTDEHPGSDLMVPAASFCWQQALRVVEKEERTKLEVRIELDHPNCVRARVSGILRTNLQSAGFTVAQDDPGRSWALTAAAAASARARNENLSISSSVFGIRAESSDSVRRRQAGNSKAVNWFVKFVNLRELIDRRDLDSDAVRGERVSRGGFKLMS